MIASQFDTITRLFAARRTSSTIVAPAKSCARIPKAAESTCRAQPLHTALARARAVARPVPESRFRMKWTRTRNVTTVARHSISRRPTPARLADPTRSGTHVGLRFWPHGRCSCDNLALCIPQVCILDLLLPQTQGARHVPSP
jgi:hypothetical protein